MTAEHALAWAVLPGGDPSWHAYRLAVARGFAAWLRTVDPAAEIPPAGLIPSRKRRATPYLYTDAEITALMTAAESLRFPLRTATYQALIGLLAVTGMRVGEAISLDRGDADLDGRRADRPERQARQVPPGPGARHHRPGAAGLPAAAGQALPGRADPRGPHLAGRNQAALLQRPRHLEEARRVRRACGPGRAAAGRAFMTCATHSPSAPCSMPTSPGATARPCSPLLSTYLGHADPKATYWYLTASPELMAAAGQRLGAWLERP